MSRHIVHEDDEQVIYQEEGGTPGEPGHWVSTRVEWKPGHEPPPSPDERIAALEDEVREMREASTSDRSTTRD